MEGYIKLHRKIIDWQWYADRNTFRLFLYLLLNANYEDKHWKNILVKRGQLITSLVHLANGTGLSIQQVRTSLEKLKSTQEITQEVTQKYSLITIVKYSDYQDTTLKNNTIPNTISNIEITTTKEIKNNKEISSSSIVSEYEKNIGTLNGIVLEELESYAEDMSEELIIEAIHIAGRNNKKMWSYIKGILNNWNTKGYKVVADIEDRITNEREERLRLLEGL